MLFLGPLRKPFKSKSRRARTKGVLKKKKRSRDRSVNEANLTRMGRRMLEIYAVLSSTHCGGGGLPDSSSMARRVSASLRRAEENT